MRDTELMAKWFEDVGTGLRRRVKDLDEDALEWRADDRGNNVRETVWHMARWIDVLTRFLAGTQPSTERWFMDGWAERTGYDPRGVGTDGLGVLSGYTFAEVEAIPKLRADQLRGYLGTVCDALVPRLRAADDAGAKRYASVVQGALGHLGEIATLRALYDRRAV